MDGLDGYAPFRIISRMAFSDSGSDSFREIEVRYHRHFHHYQLFCAGLMVYFS